jgi:hypothetical protein
MGTTLDISSSSRLLPVSSERKAHLKKIGFQKGKSGNKKGRPRLDKDVRTWASVYSVDCIYQLIDIVRDKSNPVYTRMQAARAILSCAYNKNKKIQEMKFHEIEVFMHAVQLHYGMGLPKGRIWQLAENLASDNAEIYNRALEQALAEKAVAKEALAESENYAADL